MTHKNARPPEKVNREFVRPKGSPAQRKRAEEALEAERHKAHQAQLKADMYERIGQRPPDPDRDRDFHDEFGDEAA